jgi:hypothetical protein
VGVSSYQKDSKRDPEKWIESFTVVGRRFLCLSSPVLKLSAKAGFRRAVSGMGRFHSQAVGAGWHHNVYCLDRAVFQFFWIVQN